MPETGPLASPWRLPLRTEPWAPDDCKARTCPLCGAWWKPWPGSVLPAHGRCIWTPEAAVALLDDPRVQTELADALGVSISVIRAGLKAGEQHRASTLEAVLARPSKDV